MITIKNLRNDKMTDEFDIRVDRKSILGNPFYLESENQRDHVCDKYEEHFNNQLKSNPKFKMEIDRLISIYIMYGRLNLFCWCASRRCHAETIKNYIEREVNILE